ncbi:hypothetical protein Sru01_12710 [Sphaerisporangium rufum]|uniref:SGNH hydrolase-type esterase domain-containing protein n=1 Tax=Sphaerisporangium rufum TaxID=1381558 RepID=A0A919UXW9_9ACTN|nr:GDSL-type esterase/lipase family protein [Sphaerisporangium rufum]GII76289.1 hypothetical protein Sru01_12710 [Sphaerisporangium rufum]
MTATAAPPRRVAAGAVPRIMIVGDSISQGRDGDRTWRYRLWQEFRWRGVTATLVGPWQGTWFPPAGHPGDTPAAPDDPRHAGRYRPGADFPERRHYASWGRLLREARDNIGGAVAAHRPACLMVALGFNDLAWGVSGPGALLADLAGFLDAARAAEPGMRLLVANVVHRTPLAGRPQIARDIAAYNRRLPAVLAGLSTPRSPLTLVDLAARYDPFRDSYDGVHPNASGELKIAAAFAAAYTAAPGPGRSRSVHRTGAVRRDVRPRGPVPVLAAPAR